MAIRKVRSLQINGLQRLVSNFRDPAWQQQGIGTQMFEFVCNKGTGNSLYLETDKLSNVRLYERFGFVTLDTPRILDVPSWVMMR